MPWGRDGKFVYEIYPDKDLGHVAEAFDDETAEEIVRALDWIERLRVIARPIVDIETARGRAALFELFDEIRLAE